MIWQHILYDWPSAALLLFIVGLLAWVFAALHRYRQHKLSAFADPEVLAEIMVERYPLSFWLKSALCSLAWICAVIALMGPKGNERYATPQGKTVPQKPQEKIKRMKTHQVILLLDASASMNIADAAEGKSREDIAKEIADNIVSELKGENVALYAFTSATMQLVPLTTDYLFTRIMIRQMGINEGETAGTDIKQALEAVRRSFFSTPTPAIKTLIVLSDGGDTSLYGLDSAAQAQAIDAIIKPIEDAEEQHLRVFTVGIGSKEGKPVPGIVYQGHPVVSGLEEAPLRKLAFRGRGQFFVANESVPWQISTAISKAIAQEQSYADESVMQLRGPSKDVRIYDYYFQIPLGIAIGALAFVLIFPDTRRRKEGVEG
jgi:Ca-activated chloride channel homolog